MRSLLLTATAGALAFGSQSLAQNAKQGNSKENNPDRHTFVSCDTLLDATVISLRNQDEAADVDDLVIDTRNGQAVYAIIDTNGILGTNNKVVAVPYGALSWRPAQERYVLDATAEQLRNLPEYDSENIAHLHDASWFSTMKGVFGEREEFDQTEGDRSDEYSWHFTKGRPETLTGEIVAVNREAKTAHGGVCYAVVVKDSRNDKRRTVLLAPVTYMKRQPTMPSEGNEVTVTTIKSIDAKGEEVYVARSIEFDGNQIAIRDSDGRPRWNSDDARSTRTFYKLASDLEGADLYAGGEEFGSVNDVIFEAQSGTAAFAVISTGGVLGIDDTLYPIPCGSFTRTHDNKLYTDMPASKLKLAPKLSEDGVEDLNQKEYMRRVCEYYGVEPKEFDTHRTERWSKQVRSNRK